jgi:hypothetical protein
LATQIKSIVCVLMIAAAGVEARIQTSEPPPGFSREWHFDKGPSELRISVSLPPQDPNSLLVGIGLVKTGTWTVADERTALESVSHDLQETGHGGANLGGIALRLNEPDAIRKIATEAARSARWRKTLQRKNQAETYAMTGKLIDASSAYSDWNKIFGPAGHTLKVASVEEVILVKFEESGAVCPIDVDCRNLLVPLSALIELRGVDKKH